MAGIRYAAGHEASFRQEAAVFLVSLPVAFLVSTGWIMFLVLVGSILFMLIIELLNTALEAVCNGLSRDYMMEIKVAKDCGSAAVLFSVILAGMVWIGCLSIRFFG
jgi:diacylglycerol kinase (ATP)